VIKVYSCGSCGSCGKAVLWFKKYGLKVERINIRQISKEDLVRALYLQNEGMDSIVKRAVKSTGLVRNARLDLMEMRFNEGIDFLQNHPEILQTPIIIEGEKCLVGYNEEEIRQFLPRASRRRMF